MDEIINYRDIPAEEVDAVLASLRKTSFFSARSDGELKGEMNHSRADSLPQYVFVRREGRVIGYMFLIGETVKNPVFPWWACHNGDELPLETDLRLLEYGAELCRKAGAMKLARGLENSRNDHQQGLGRRPEGESL